jgi:hypothetical protein
LSSTRSSRDDDDDKKINTKATAIVGHWQTMRMCLLAAFASAPFFFPLSFFFFSMFFLSPFITSPTSTSHRPQVSPITPFAASHPTNLSLSLSLFSLSVINFPFYRLSFFVLFVFSFTLSLSLSSHRFVFLRTIAPVFRISSQSDHRESKAIRSCPCHIQAASTGKMPRLIPGQGNIHHRRGRKEEGERGTQRNATQRQQGGKQARERESRRPRTAIRPRNHLRRSARQL